MIKNVIFDFGQVLIHFEPEYMVGRFVTDPEDSKLLQEVVFDRLYWDELDAGTITDEEVLCRCRERLPERLHAVAGDIYYNWIYNIPEFDGMRRLVQEVKRTQGVNIFLLSNASKYLADHKYEIPILDEFENCVFSAVCGFVKPDRAIFEHLCKRFGIKASESVFIDDLPKNIAGVENAGIKGYLFDGDVGKLRIRLLELLKTK